MNIMNVMKAQAALRLLADLLNDEAVRASFRRFKLNADEILTLWQTANKFTEKGVKAAPKEERLVLETQLYNAVEVFETGMELAAILNTPEAFKAFEKEYEALRLQVQEMAKEIALRHISIKEQELKNKLKQ